MVKSLFEFLNLNSSRWDFPIWPNLSPGLVRSKVRSIERFQLVEVTKLNESSFNSHSFWYVRRFRRDWLFFRLKYIFKTFNELKWPYTVQIWPLEYINGLLLISGRLIYNRPLSCFGSSIFIHEPSDRHLHRIGPAIYLNDRPFSPLPPNWLLKINDLL